MTYTDNIFSGPYNWYEISIQTARLEARQLGGLRHTVASKPLKTTGLHCTVQIVIMAQT